MDLLSRFQTSLERQRLLSKGERFFVACSGGPDSTALFLLVHALSAQWNLKTGLLHFNHGLRGRSSDRDERFVKALARRFQVPCYIARGHVEARARKGRLSLEEAAREARYDFFERVAKKRRIRKIALAHTREDQAETILMRIIQGTGIRGLLGIRPQIKWGKTLLIRPLLEFSKEELLAFLKERGASFCEDRSNQSMRFVRNRLRHQLFPWLEREFNPRVVESLARISEIIREETELLALLEKAAWKRTFKGRRRQKLELDRSAFLKFPAPLQFRILERGLKRLDPKSGLLFDAWRRIQPEMSRKRFRVSLPRDIDLILTPRRLTLYKKIKGRRWIYTPGV